MRHRWLVVGLAPALAMGTLAVALVDHSALASRLAPADTTTTAPGSIVVTGGATTSDPLNPSASGSSTEDTNNLSDVLTTPADQQRSADRCIADNGDLTGGAGCSTGQRVVARVLQGSLVGRPYANAPLVGFPAASGSTASNANPDARTVSLGVIPPSSSTVIASGALNNYTIADNRGGGSGWSLTASLSDFGGNTGAAFEASRALGSFSCQQATAENAYDTRADGTAVISGFDPAAVAPGVIPGPALQSFGSTVNLCTKDGTTSPTSQSTGGIYNASVLFTVSVPPSVSATQTTYVAYLTVFLV